MLSSSSCAVVEGGISEHRVEAAEQIDSLNAELSDLRRSVIDLKDASLTPLCLSAYIRCIVFVLLARSIVAGSHKV